jgi:hypothetical protein
LASGSIGVQDFFAWSAPSGENGRLALRKASGVNAPKPFGAAF